MWSDPSRSKDVDWNGKYLKKKQYSQEPATICCLFDMNMIYILCEMEI